MANTHVLTTLDYDQLKTSLTAFYSANAFFKSYDFDSSNLQGLIRLLSQNSFLLGFFVNMALSESFLDSCQLRSSAISRAKELNYTPQSFRSSKAVVQLSFVANTGAVSFLKGESFSSVVNNNLLVYSIPESFVIASTNGFFQANVTLYEGGYFNDTYVFDSTDDTQRLVITNPSVDTTSITVAVFENGSTVAEAFSPATTLLGLNETSKVFFVQEAENELYEVIFGDGILGYKPADGSIIVLDYRVSRGTDGDGATSYAINFNPGNGAASFINTISFDASSGGANVESLNSIKLKAPRHFEVQERAVGASDYGILLQEQFPEIDAVSAYGGEKLNPPQYGSVVVAVDIAGVDGIPESKRIAYYNFLKPRCPLTINPIFVSPARQYVKVESIVTYNVNDTVLAPTTMGVLVQQSILGFAANNLGTFNATLRSSKLATAIDATDDSIEGSQTSLTAYQKISPARGAPPVIWTLDFGQPLYRNEEEDVGVKIHSHAVNTVTSDPFQFAGTTYTLQDDSEGAIRLLYNGNLLQQVGTVDYDKGLIQLNNFQADFYNGPWIRIFAKPAAQDVVSDNATILLIESNGIVVKPVAVRT